MNPSMNFYKQLSKPPMYNRVIIKTQRLILLFKLSLCNLWISNIWQGWLGGFDIINNIFEYFFNIIFQRILK